MNACVREVRLPHEPKLVDEAFVDGQAAFATELLTRGRDLARRLSTRRIWMLSSTATGGGVAEMLPSTCGLLRAVGLDVRWLVLEPRDERFFTITKAIHHLLHGRDPGIALGAVAADQFARVAEAAAHSLNEHVEPDDILVVHDPQPCALPAFLAVEKRVRAIWRCHVGVPTHNARTAGGWGFLTPWLTHYERLLFSSERYVPAGFEARSGVLHPAIDPLSHKNRALAPYKLLGVLRSAGLVDGVVPPWAAFGARAQRYVDGAFRASPPPDLLWSPVILQVSRFDPLKGFATSLEAFRLLCEAGPARAARLRAASARSEDELARCILLCAGPDPAGVADDPEATRVLDELVRQRDALPAAVATRVHIVKLPMDDCKQNALMVNALQRLASLIVQPSIEEGFGLTVTEALWKGTPIAASNVGGISQQIRPGIDGLLVEAGNAEALSNAMLEQLVLVKNAERMASAARKRVSEHYLVLREALGWLDVLERVLERGAQPTRHDDDSASRYAAQETR